MLKRFSKLPECQSAQALLLNNKLKYSSDSMHLPLNKKQQRQHSFPTDTKPLARESRIANNHQVYIIFINNVVG
jgi:hypothetical protein